MDEPLSITSEGSYASVVAELKRMCLVHAKILRGLPYSASAPCSEQP